MRDCVVVMRFAQECEIAVRRLAQECESRGCTVSGQNSGQSPERSEYGKDKGE